MNHDIEKLGITQSIIFIIIKMYKLFMNKECYLGDVFDSKCSVTLKECKNLINMFRKIIVTDKTNFGEFIKSIFDIINIKSSITKSLKKKIFGDSEFSLDDLKSLLSKLEPNCDYSIYDININIFFKWYDFLIEKESNNIKYHTFHITKGLEYENVVIVLEDRFRRNNDMKNFLIDCIEAIKTKNYENINANQKDFRNLLYVATTRSKKNLFIVNYSTIPTSELETIFSS